MRRFISEFPGPVNISHMPEHVDAGLPVSPTPSPAELAALGVARVSWAIFLYLDAMARFQEHLGALQD